MSNKGNISMSRYKQKYRWENVFQQGYVYAQKGDSRQPLPYYYPGFLEIAKCIIFYAWEIHIRGGKILKAVDVYSGNSRSAEICKGIIYENSWRFIFARSIAPVGTWFNVAKYSAFYVIHIPINVIQLDVL